MNRILIQTFLIGALGTGALKADFSYEQTSKITGGAMASMMKVMGALSKQLREPMVSTVIVKGDRMAHVNANTASIIDLSAETITHVDFQKKTYSVMTFAEMQKMMADLAQKAQGKKQEGAAMEFKASVENTGKTKTINGFETKEMVMKLMAEMTDEKSGQKGAMNIVSDMWIAPRIPGYEEVSGFHARMGAKLNWTPGMNPMMMQNGGAAKGYAELAKEMAKMDGMPVYQVMAMGGDGTVPAGAEPGTAPAQGQEQQKADKPSLGGALGGALGGRFGGLGRKKKPAEDPPPAEQQQAKGHTPGSGGAGSLLEMTTEMSKFSSAAVDPSKLSVPAGFKKVDADKRAR